MFKDRVTLDLIAGKGGNGTVSWRREKFIPKGGPNGGNGGNGGSIILQVDPNLLSLEKFRNFRKMKAENGKQGGAKLSQGKKGKSLILNVPLGTLVKDTEDGQILFDFTKESDKLIICNGGRGGRGNASFKTSTNRAPNTATPGRQGESKRIELELKIIADIGLVGFPNAGKSTLFSSITKARAKIGAYPFTTLHPNIGFIETEDYNKLFIADIPGIIEMAHMGKGLGTEFLRHIERTKLLIYILDASGIDGRTPTQDYKVLLNETSSYNKELLKLPYLVVLNKIDSPDAKKNIAKFKKTFSIDKDILFEISALSGKGVSDLIGKLKQ